MANFDDNTNHSVFLFNLLTDMDYNVVKIFFENVYVYSQTSVFCRFLVEMKTCAWNTTTLSNIFPEAVTKLSIVIFVLLFTVILTFMYQFELSIKNRPFHLNHSGISLWNSGVQAVALILVYFTESHMHILPWKPKSSTAKQLSKISWKEN